MATCDRIVSQPDVVGHLKTDELKIFVDDSLGDFGSEDCQFLAISSEWVSIPEKEFDPSKLILLKKNMQNKKFTNIIHVPTLSIEVNAGVSVESSKYTNHIHTKKKRRKRRKKNKLLIAGKPVLEVEIMNGVSIQSAAPVLEIEYGIDIAIPSLSLNSGVTGDQQCMLSNGSVYLSDDRAVQNKNLDNTGTDDDDTRSNIPAILNDESQHLMPIGNVACKNLESNCQNMIVQLRNDDSAGQEYQDSPKHRQADLVSPIYQQANYDSNFGTYGTSDDGYSSHVSQSSIFPESNQNPCIELYQKIQSHTGIFFNGKESEFISLSLILQDINQFSDKFSNQIGIDKSLLQYFQVWVVNDMDSASLSMLDMNFKFNSIGTYYPPEFCPLHCLVRNLLQKNIQYGFRLVCAGALLKKLQFLFREKSSSLNFHHSNKNNNNKNNKNKNNRHSSNNSSRRFQYSRRRGRKKRQYQMVYKNKLQNVQCKHFGNDDNYASSYHNSVVHTKLVTARAPRCAPISKE